MLQIQVLSGRKTGQVFEGGRDPIVVGRSEDANIILDDPGIWPVHGRLRWNRDGIYFAVGPNALASVNGVQVAEAIVRSGDIISLGGVNLRLGLCPVRQTDPRWAEWFTWIALAFLCLGQIAVIYWLCQ